MERDFNQFFRFVCDGPDVLSGVKKCELGLAGDDKPDFIRAARVRGEPGKILVDAEYFYREGHSNGSHIAVYRGSQKVESCTDAPLQNKGHSLELKVDENGAITIHLDGKHLEAEGLDLRLEVSDPVLKVDIKGLYLNAADVDLAKLTENR